MKLESLEAKCMDCGKKFLTPTLGDQSYGYGIFSGEKGSVFGCFQALDNPAWDFVETTIEKNKSSKRVIGDLVKNLLKSKKTRRQEMRNHGEKFWVACAYFADPIKGQRLSHRDVCPRCYSSNVELGRKLNEVLEVYDVSHREFLSFPETVRKQKVLEFDRSYQS